MRQCGKNILEQGWQQITIWRTRIACRIHSEYVTLTAFPLQQWLYERAATLRYTYIACLTLLFYFIYPPRCHTSCGIPSRCFPSHPDCNAVVYFLFFSCFTLHASLRARRWDAGAYIRNKTAAISQHHWALCVRNMSMIKSIKVSVSCSRLVMFFALWSQNVLIPRTLGFGYNTRNFVKT